MNRKFRKLIKQRFPSALLLAFLLVVTAMMVCNGKGFAGLSALLLGVAAVGSFMKNFQFPGMAFSNQAVAAVTFDTALIQTVDLPAGKAGSLTTRTDDDTGVVTVASGHGITASDFVDLYWSGGNRFGVDVTAVTDTTISINIGSGDNLPAQDTAVVITKQVTKVCNIDGDAVQLFGLFLRSTDSAAKGSADLQDSGGNSIEQFDLTEVDTSVNGMQHAYQSAAAIALLTGNVITVVKASNGSSSAAAVLYICTGTNG